MKLSLSVITYQDQPPGQPISIVLNQQPARIGRAKDNSWILPDKDRYLSNHHASIEYRGSDYFITDTSTNGVFLNHSTAPLGHGNSAKLGDGDHLSLGEYEISVIIIEDASKDETSTLSATPTTNGAISFEPFEEFDSNVLDRVIEENALIPEGIGIEEENACGSGSQHGSPLNDAFPQTTEEPKVQSPQPDPVPEPPSSEFKIPENWFGDDDSLGDDLIEGNSPFQPEIKEEISEKASEPVPTPKLAVTNISSDSIDLHTQALEQFLEGAELNNPDLKEAMESNTFHTLGKIFRTSIKGTRDLLIARAEMKNEIRMNVTTIRPTENNPLKFSVNVDDALTRLLLPEQGCMPPEQAISEAFDDIRAHQIAVLAGMQTALKSLLKRFDPEVLEHRLQESNPIIANIPIQKQAKLWDLFEQLHEEIENEAEDNFYHLFGQAFASAYEEQIQKLKHNNKKIH